MVILTIGTLYFVFQSRIFQTVIISAITKNISKKTNTDVSIKRVDIAFFRKVILEDVYLSDQQKDTLFYSKRMVANIDSFSWFNRRVHLKSITFDRPYVNISKLDSSNYNFNFLIHLFSSDRPVTPGNWRFFCRRFDLNKGKLAWTADQLPSGLVNLLNAEQFNVSLDSFYLLNKNHFSVNLERLKFKSRNGFELENFSSRVVYSDSIFLASNLFGKTKNSQISIDTIELKLNEYLLSNKVTDLKMKLDLQNLDFGMRDLAFFLGPDYDKALRTTISGKIQGDIYNIRGKEFRLSVENFTHLNGDFYINGLSDIKSAYIFFNLNESYANLNEIRNLDLPIKIQQAIDQLPPFLENVGTFNYKGNFTGFIDDFVAYGTAYSNLGIITSDISLKPLKGEQIKVNGHLRTDNLDIGSILNNGNLDKLSLTGELNGTIDYHSNYDLTFDGWVDSVDFNEYRFHKIDLIGTLQNNKFKGDFSISDPNLQMKYSGTLDLSPELPIFEFVANIEHANLYNLNLVDDEGTEINLNVDANFVGNNIDNVKGHLALTDIFFQNSIDEFYVKQLILNNSPRGDTSVFSISSDMLDGELVGKYSLMNLGKSLVSFYQKYLPSSYFTLPQMIAETNDFEFHFFVKDIFSVTKVFVPDLYIQPNFSITGRYQPIKDSIYAETIVPFIQFQTKKFENVKVVLDGDATRIHARAKSDKISLGPNLNIYNITFETTGQDDELSLDVFWNNYEENTFSGKLKTLTTFKRNESDYPSITMKIEPSNIYFSDSIWTIDETVINIDSSSVSVRELNFHHNDQRFLIDGKIAKNSLDHIYAKIENVEMILFEPLMGASYFTGRLNGYASLVDAYEKMKLNVELSINDLSFDNGPLGDLTMTGIWDNDKDNLISQVSLINENKTIFEADGVIDPKDNRLDMNLVFDNSPITILQVILPSTFNNEQGLVKGNVHVHGPTFHILHDGVITPVSKVGIGLSYLNTTYFFSDPVTFSNDSILFKNVRFEDEKGNTGLFNGSLKHQSFNKFVYNLRAETNNLLVLNTTSLDNDYFYGTGYAGGIVNIKGAGANIILDGDIKTQKGTSVFIPYDSGEDAVQYDFIEFVNSKIKFEEENKYDVVTTGLEMNFDLDVTPDAKVQIIFNSQVGDIIKGSGSGNLQIKVDRNYNLSMYGHYTIEEGDYLFTLRNVMNKRFSIVQGSSIEWVGDPYDALINIRAIYKLKTSLYDLFVGGYQDIDLNRRIPVDCVILLTENLMTPKIDFSIELPTAEERIKDEVAQLIVTKEDINKQIISLMMLGRFYTPEFYAGKPSSATSSDLLGTTASEMFSNQLSNWLSKISDNFDFGIKYRPGNELSENQVELALSTQILNDRITIDGNVANNANPNANNSGAVVGDFDVNVKLTDNGKLRLKAYNHSNDNIIYDTSPYTWGVGLSYREEFNSFAELPKRIIAFFKEKFKTKNKEPELNNE
ncbi:MAG: translocation/assembly module TamB domain-containing protein [Prolixibacteraceae bacterium]